MLKNNPLLLIFVFCFSVSFAQTDLTVSNQLVELNKYWKEKAFDYPELELKKALYGDRELIQTHLTLVIRSLRNSHHNFSPKQLNNRAICLDILEEYCERGIFPKNEFHAKRTPYFIDRYGTACAVGYLIIQTGHKDLAERISKENNYAYIEDMDYPEIVLWAKEYGFTIDELKWIQPTYGSCNTICSPGTKKDVSCYGDNDGCIGFPQVDSVQSPFSLQWFKYYSGSWNALGSSEACDLYAGEYKCEITGANGGVETHYYTISQPDSIPSDTSITACESYLAPNGITYTTSGQKQILACDSLSYNINLTILSSVDTTWSITSCNSYTAPDGTIYNTSGTYEVVLTNATGCDSTIQIDLTILNDALSIQQQNDSLFSTIQGDAYQWLDCDVNYTAIPNATNATFIPANSGNYAIAVTTNGCTDTSACYNYVSLKTGEEQSNESITLYPNPNNGSFTFNFGKTMKNIQIQIVDAEGKVVFQKEHFSASPLEISASFKAGLYFAKIYSNKKEIETISFTVK